MLSELSILCALSGGLNYVRKVFGCSPHRSVFLWNFIIRAYAQAHMFDETFWMFHQMLHGKKTPDSVSYACVVMLARKAEILTG